MFTARTALTRTLAAASTVAASASTRTALRAATRPSLTAAPAATVPSARRFYHEKDKYLTAFTVSYSYCGCDPATEVQSSPQLPPKLVHLNAKLDIDTILAVPPLNIYTILFLSLSSFICTNFYFVSSLH